MSRRPVVLALLVRLSVGPGALLPLYLQQRFAAPLQLSVYDRDRVAGSNNALKSRSRGAGIQVFFGPSLPTA